MNAPADFQLRIHSVTHRGVRLSTMHLAIALYHIARGNRSTSKTHRTRRPPSFRATSSIADEATAGPAPPASVARARGGFRERLKRRRRASARDSTPTPEVFPKTLPKTLPASSPRRATRRRRARPRGTTNPTRGGSRPTRRSGSREYGVGSRSPLSTPLPTPLRRNRTDVETLLMTRAERTTLSVGTRRCFVTRRCFCASTTRAFRRRFATS